MSQFTPPPGNQSQYQSGFQTNYLPPQPKDANVPAIISLVTGILSCVPLISIVAVITGLLGISNARKPNVGGKGLATAGLILGIIGLLWTITAGGLFIAGRHAIQKSINSPAHVLAKQFVADVTSGNAATVLADCDSSISSDKIDAVVSDAKKWGTLTDSTLFAAPAAKGDNGVETSMVGGMAVYSNGKKIVRITVINPSTNPKISDFNFTDQNSTTFVPETTTAP